NAATGDDMDTMDTLHDVAALCDDDLADLWRDMAAEVDCIGVALTPAQGARLEILVEELDELEGAILATPAYCEDEAKLKLEIVARAINGGADAAHIVSLFDRCRDDLLAHGHISLLQAAV